MAVKRPLALYSGELEEIRIGDTIATAVAPGATASQVTARIRRSTNQSIAVGSSYLDLSWDTADYQANGSFWTTGATVTIPETGYYLMFAEATFDASTINVPVTGNIQLYLNNTTTIGEDEAQLLDTANVGLSIIAQRYLTIGDTLKVQVKHSHSSAINILTQGNHSPDIIITKINGAKGDVIPTEVTIDFGTIPVYSKGFTFNFPFATVGQKVIISNASVDDDAEMDTLILSSHVSAANTIKTYAHAHPGPITGQRKINIIIG